MPSHSSNLQIPQSQQTRIPHVSRVTSSHLQWPSTPQPNPSELQPSFTNAKPIQSAATSVVDNNGNCKPPLEAGDNERMDVDIEAMYEIKEELIMKEESCTPQSASSAAESASEPLRKQQLNQKSNVYFITFYPRISLREICAFILLCSDRLKVIQNDV